MSHRQITKMATLEERNRVARDIHDSLGHYLTVVNVQLEKALAFRAKDPEEAEQAVHNAKRLADQALEEVRKSVGALRNNTEVFSFTHSVAELVENVQSHLLKVDFEQIGNEEGFSRETLIVLFRAVQEGLTNIQRHAGATKADIKISFGTKEGFLLISDNGQGFEVANKLANGRFGLSGLQERLERIGGAIKIDSHPGQGTHLSITVPKNSGVLTTPLQTR
jgi:signal transduction histidine kinase